MRVLVTGVKGQLGYDVAQHLKLRGFEYRGVSIDDFDLTDIAVTDDYIRDYRPDAVIHCAAYTDVDKAEDDKERCYAVNVVATANIADICSKIGTKLVYISTDYVFSGNSDIPYEVDSETNPLSIYGNSKLEGEKAVLNRVNKYFIIRTSWAFGIHGKNFVNTMLHLSKKKSVLQVVSDQIGSPTYTYDLARLIVEMIETEKYGVYHATNENYCSWAEFAEEIFRITGTETRIEYIQSEQFIVRARRPKNSRLSKSSLDLAGFSRLPTWKDALLRYIDEMGRSRNE